ncbi:MAG: COQ9 family protein [Proteobacteria bacterium]|nr:COQ9 family protein [Pseudomonadota bacterium]
MTKRRDRAALADRLLDATLAQVPFEGWTSLAMRAAAVEVGVDWPTAKRIFPGGVGDMLALWGARNDARMIAALADIDLDALRIRERIAACVRVRLEALEPHREAVRAALCRAGLPHNAPAAARALWRTVDAMWRAAGDTATDFNYYSKRGLLSGVYGATLLFWLEDDSENRADSWAFLDRRIADVMRVPRAMGRLKKLVPDPQRLLRAFVSLRSPRGSLR